VGRRASMWSLRRAKLGGFRKALLTSGVIDPAPRKLSSAHPARPCGSVLTARAHVRAIRPVTRARADVSHGARYEYGVGPENGWRDGKGRAHAATPCGRAGARRAPHPPPLVEKCPSTREVPCTERAYVLLLCYCTVYQAHPAQPSSDHCIRLIRA